MLIRVVNISTSDSTRSIALANNPAIDPPCWTPGNQGPQAFGCGISHSPSGTKIASLTQPHTTAEPVPLNADSHAPVVNQWSAGHRGRWLRDGEIWRRPVYLAARTGGARVDGEADPDPQRLEPAVLDRRPTGHTPRAHPTVDPGLGRGVQLIGFRPSRCVSDHSDGPLETPTFCTMWSQYWSMSAAIWDLFMVLVPVRKTALTQTASGVRARFRRDGSACPA